MHITMLLVIFAFSFAFLAGLSFSSPITTEPAARNTESSLITARDQGKRPPPICNVQNWGAASVAAFQTVMYEISHRADCIIQPASCMQLACYGGAAAYLCNDNVGLAWELDCRSLATYVNDIILTCQYSTPSGPVATGQEFDYGNFNVFLRADNC